MSGDEFIYKALAGERDFRGIYLPNFNLDAHDGHKELQSYFEKQDFSKKITIDISGSNLEGLVASNLYLPYVKANGTQLFEAHLESPNFENGEFKGANLRDAFLAFGNLKGAKFHKANLRRAILYGAILQGAYLKDADLWQAEFNGANLDDANIEKANAGMADFSNASLERAVIYDANLAMANFDSAIIRGIIGLDLAYGLEYAFFRETRIGKGERKIAKKIMRLYEDDIEVVQPDNYELVELKKEIERRKKEELNGRPLFIFKKSK